MQSNNFLQRVLSNKKENDNYNLVLLKRNGGNSSSTEVVNVQELHLKNNEKP